MIKKLSVLMATAAIIASPMALQADDYSANAREHATSIASKWINNPIVINAIKAQNIKNAALSQDEIITLDKKWRAEVKSSSKPMVDNILKNDLSKYLDGVKNNSEDFYSEIFVMDNKGLNVGQSDITSDYWQGDEAKWQKTFSVGSDAIHVSEVKFDESTQTLQMQLSISISDGGAPIGAVTIGLNAEQL